MVYITDKPLLRLGCACRGTLEYGHEHCIHQWVRVQKSATCEVCKNPFHSSVVPPVDASVNVDGLSLGSNGSEDIWERIDRVATSSYISVFQYFRNYESLVTETRQPSLDAN